MQFIIIFSNVLAYFITGFFMAGIVSGYDGHNLYDDSSYLLIALLWPIALLVLSSFGVVWIGSKLGKKIKKCVMKLF